MTSRKGRGSGVQRGMAIPPFSESGSLVSPAYDVLPLQSIASVRRRIFSFGLLPSGIRGHHALKKPIRALARLFVDLIAVAA